MSKAANDLNECKAFVRSVLLSAKNGLDLGSFLSDYNDMVMEPLPYKALGYPSPEVFLKSMPDVVSIEVNRFGVTLHGVPDASTKKLQELIQHQRDPKKKSRSRRLPARGSGRYRGTGRPRGSGRTTGLGRPGGSSRQGYSATLYVPFSLQKKVHNLLIKNGGVLSDLDIFQKYRQENGRDLEPSRCGYDSIEQFFSDIPGLVTATRSHALIVTRLAGTDDRPSQAISAGRFPPGTQPNGANTMPPPRMQRGMPAREIPPLMSCAGDATDKPHSLRQPDHGRPEREVYKPPSQRQKEQKTEAANSMPHQQAQYNQSQRQTQRPPMPQQPVPSMQSVSKTIRTIIEKEGELKSNSLLWKYKEYTGNHLPLNKLGFNSVLTLAQEVENVKIEQISQSEWIFRLPVKSSTSDAFMPQLSQSESLSKAASEFVLIRSQGRISSDAVGPGARYKFLGELPEHKYIEVFVSYIKRPDYMFLQRKGKRFNEALESLMDHLEEVYTSLDGEHYRITDSYLTENLVCAALYPGDKNWHRAIVTNSVNGDGFVEVLFVDYGEKCSVHNLNLRLLKECFLHFPAQAIPAKLHGIVPAPNFKGVWTQIASQRIIQLVYQKSIIAYVEAYEGNMASVYLTDTSTAEDLHFNKLLVNEGWAVPQEQSHGVVNTTSDVANLDDLSDLDELETGTSDGAGSSSVTDEDSPLDLSDLTEAEFKVVINHLKLERKKLQRMLLADATVVDELMEVENKIELVEKEQVKALAKSSKLTQVVLPTPQTPVNSVTNSMAAGSIASSAPLHNIPAMPGMQPIPHVQTMPSEVPTSLPVQVPNITALPQAQPLSVSSLVQSAPQLHSQNIPSAVPLHPTRSYSQSAAPVPVESLLSNPHITQQLAMLQLQQMQQQSAPPASVPNTTDPAVLAIQRQMMELQKALEKIQSSSQ